MPDGDIVIEEITDATSDVHAALTELLSHLSSVAPPDEEELVTITLAPETTLLGARADGELVGTLALAVFPVLTGKRAWIEDVVVLPEVRGRGVATALVEEALRRAARAGCRTVDLTSRPSRIEANRLYEKLGFQRRETNVYRKALDSA